MLAARAPVCTAPVRGTAAPALPVRRSGCLTRRTRSNPSSRVAVRAIDVSVRSTAAAGIPER